MELFSGLSEEDDNVGELGGVVWWCQFYGVDAITWILVGKAARNQLRRGRDQSGLYGGDIASLVLFGPFANGIGGIASPVLFGPFVNSIGDIAWLVLFGLFDNSIRRLGETNDLLRMESKGYRAVSVRR